MIANNNGHDQIVETLLEYGASVDQKDGDGSTLLYSAAQRGSNDTVQTLLMFGASVDEPSADGETPLHAACDFDYVQCVLILLAAGADVHAKRNDGVTALHLAGWSREATKIVPLLVAVGADLDAYDQDGRTARQILADRHLQVDLSEVALERARRDIAQVRLDFVRYRSLEICIGLQMLRLDALQMCEILEHSCGAMAPLIRFHQWWNIATTVKHFHRN